MARAKVLGKSILLIILIIILVLAGLLWFDYLGVIRTKHIFAPVFRLVGLEAQTSVAPSSPKDLAEADLDNDRFAKRLEALDLRTEELDKREQDIEQAENNNAQVAQELEDQKKAQEEREKTFNNEVQKYENRDRNIEQIVQWLTGMQPAVAVEKLLEMPDQDIIDVLRKAEADAQASGTSSLSSYWLQLMPAERGGVLLRKMESKPTSLN